MAGPGGGSSGLKGWWWYEQRDGAIIRAVSRKGKRRGRRSDTQVQRRGIYVFGRCKKFEMSCNSHVMDMGRRNVIP